MESDHDKLTVIMTDIKYIREIIEDFKPITQRVDNLERWRDTQAGAMRFFMWAFGGSVVVMGMITFFMAHIRLF